MHICSNIFFSYPIGNNSCGSRSVPAPFFYAHFILTYFDFHRSSFTLLQSFLSLCLSQLTIYIPILRALRCNRYLAEEFHPKSSPARECLAVLFRRPYSSSFHPQCFAVGLHRPEFYHKTRLSSTVRWWGERMRRWERTRSEDGKPRLKTTGEQKNRSRDLPGMITCPYFLYFYFLYFTLSFSALPALNTGTFLASMVTVSPVLGFRP